MVAKEGPWVAAVPGSEAAEPMPIGAPLAAAPRWANLAKM
jgi:hypothetical protein